MFHPSTNLTAVGVPNAHAKSYEGAAMHRVTEEAKQFADAVLKIFLHSHKEMTSPHPVRPLSLVAELSHNFPVAEASHSAGFAHGVTQNSGKGGPSGHGLA